jgi:hypothetical protein
MMQSYLGSLQVAYTVMTPECFLFISTDYKMVLPLDTTNATIKAYILGHWINKLVANQS